MADIFREVDEDLRRDNFEKLWKKYGKFAIALAVIVVIAVGGAQAWKAYDKQRRGAQSDSFSAALATGRGGDAAGGAAALLDLADPGAGGYPGLAALERARLLAEAGDTDGAIVLWDQISADSGLGTGFRDVATLLSVLHQADTGDPAMLRQRLEALAGDGLAFRGSARELMAVLALRAGDKAEATELYTQIADDRDLPAGLRARAAQMLAALKG